jgi:hypothetical protein
MTDEQINAAIAEACGWTDIRRELTVGYSTNHLWWAYPPMKTEQGGNAYQYLPNYCGDLNAIHEAEKVLMVDQIAKYFWLLCDFSGKNNPFMATARQRAEAFLRTLGKWE